MSRSSRGTPPLRNCSTSGLLALSAISAGRRARGRDGRREEGAPASRTLPSGGAREGGRWARETAKAGGAKAAAARDAGRATRTAPAATAASIAGAVCALITMPRFTSPSWPRATKGASLRVTAIPPALPTERSTSCRASTRCDSPSLSTRFNTVVPSTFASTQLLRRARTLSTRVPEATGTALAVVPDGGGYTRSWAKVVAEGAAEMEGGAVCGARVT